VKISELSISRPVLATVMNILIVLIGLIAYLALPVREYPNIDVPVITVETAYPGANAKIMESQVTQILEDSLSGIEGIDFMSSKSRSEKSQITLTFKLDRDPDSAASDVRDRVGRVRGQLPEDISEPIVAKVEADAQPIIWLAFSSDRHSPLQVTDIAERQARDPLQTIPGVASVAIVGERRYSMRIWLDRTRMAAYGITSQGVEAALRSQNIEVPAGRIESTEREFTVLTQTDLNTEKQFEDIVLRNENGYLIRIKDIANVEIAPETERVISRFSGRSAVALGVVKQSTANPLDVSSGVRIMLEEINKKLPEGVAVNVAYDSSVFIDKSIQSVKTTIFEAVLLVILVIFLFLRNARATLIPLITIPVSLIGAFAIMNLFGFSINTLTLLALVLAIGLVVDDAIVVLENIYRHIEDGMDPIQASFKGMKEIGFAVVAMTVTLAAVFAPIAFSEGRTGKLISEFALTLAGAVIVSGFVALTLSPMMASRMLKHNENPGKFYLWGEKVLNGMANGYEKVLRKILVFPRLIALMGLVTIALSAVVYTQLPQELSPSEDRGFVIGFAMAPEGSTLEFVDKYTRQIEGVLSKVPEANNTFTIIGFPTSTNSMQFVQLAPWEDRERSQQEIAGSLMGPMFGGITGVMSFPMNPPSLGQSIVSRPVEFVIQTTGSYEELQALTNQVMGKVWTNPMFAQPDIDLKLNKPELAINVNREKAAAMGVGVETIGRTLETMIAGREVTRYKQDGEQYNVMVQVADIDRSNPSDLTNVYVRSSKGEMVQLANLVEVSETIAPKELNHFNKLKSATIQAALNPGYSQQQAKEFLDATVAELTADKAGFQVDYGGQLREFISTGSSLTMAFGLALVFIYLVLAAQFESFRSPLIIMFSVPTAMLGALLALWLTGGSINVYSQIGLITLVGLITKHGILIVEFANQLQESGSSKLEAVIESAKLRLRPILMTTSAMVLGAIPLALATGAGAESREQIGWTIVGGMTLGTALTIIIVPACYLLISGKIKELAKADPTL
jgi:multidrug efflux pump